MQGRGILIAEKSNAMKDIQKHYNKHVGEFSFSLDFASFSGHLLELFNPDEYREDWKAWRVETLPMIPDQFRYKVDEQKRDMAQRLIHKLKTGNYDFVINACDAAREGELIFWSFYEHHKLKLPVYRYWASENTAAKTIKALQNLLPEKEMRGLKESAKLRQHYDWLVGMNFSRAVGIKTNSKASIGRVITPVTKIIVDREIAIRDFEPKDFFEIRGNFNSAKGEYDGIYIPAGDSENTRFEDEARARKVAASVGKTGVVKDVVQTDKVTAAPRAYSLLSLQKDANRLFKLKADETLAIAQALYDNHKILSYPRTDSEYISTSLVPEFAMRISSLKVVPELASFAQAITATQMAKIGKSKDYINDDKIADHHAIIPTGEEPVLAALTPNELKIYMIVCRRFLAIFMEPRIVSNTTLLSDMGGHIFKTTGAVEKQQGFQALYGKTAKDRLLPAVAVGDAITLKDVKVEKGTTTPPQRYTPASLLEALEHASRFVEDKNAKKILNTAKGLGAPSTQSDVMKKLEEKNFATFEKNFYIPTKYAMDLVSVLGERDICSPILTANWEAKLEEIRKGASVEEFRREMIQYVTENTQELLKNINVSLSEKKSSNRTILGKCPECGKDVVSGKEYFLCSGYSPKEVGGCRFIVKKDFFGKIISDDAMSLMLQGKPTKEMTFATKSGEKYKKRVVLSNRIHNGQKWYQISPEKTASSTAQNIEDLKAIAVCPKCGGKVYEGKSFYLCANKGVNCDFSLSKIIKGCNITLGNAKQLISGEPVGPLTFVWGSGKSGAAHIQYSKDKTKIDFIFNN